MIPFRVKHKLLLQSRRKTWIQIWGISFHPLAVSEDLYNLLTWKDNDHLEVIYLFIIASCVWKMDMMDMELGSTQHINSGLHDNLKSCGNYSVSPCVQITEDTHSYSLHQIQNEICRLIIVIPLASSSCYIMSHTQNHSEKEM